MTDFSSDRTQLRPGLGLVALSGEVDIYTAPRFKNDLVALIDEGATVVVVDLADVTFIDSTALGVLISGVKRLHEVDGRLLIVAATRPVSRILAITGLDTVLDIYPSRDEAVQAV
jgi:anti-sigma B factor antagonist